MRGHILPQRMRYDAISAERYLDMTCQLPDVTS
jgi:hypothetical protein